MNCSLMNEFAGLGGGWVGCILINIIALVETVTLSEVQEQWILSVSGRATVKNLQ